MQLYAITDRRLLPANQIESLINLTRQWAQQQIDYIQIREKDLTPPELLALTQQIVTAIRSENKTTKILLNGPAEIALNAGADGIHLPANSPAIAAAHARGLYALSGHDAIISYACHSREEVLKAKHESQQNTHPALILYAPIFEKITPGETALPGQGLEALKAAAEAAKPIPVFALGGVTKQNAPACLVAGAQGIAGIRIFLKESEFSETRR